MVVVVEDDEVSQLLVAGKAAGLGGDALFHVAVGDDHEDRRVEDALTLLRVGVVETALAAGGHGHADGRGDALAERTGGGLDA